MSFNPQRNLGIFYAMNFKFVNAAIGFTVVLAALLMGSFILMTQALPGLTGWKRVCLIVVLFTYAMFRLYRSVLMLKNTQDED